MVTPEAPTRRPDAVSPFQVLTVCTGNICRSPVAALLLAAGLPAAAGLEPQQLVVMSAGSHARADDPIDADAGSAAIALGLDPSRHRARPLVAGDVRAADLVLGLERQHRSAAVRLAPAAVRRCFTVIELARILHWMAEEGWEHQQLGAGPSPAPLRAVISGAGVQRGLVPPVDDQLELDIRDPYRRGPDAHEEAALAIASAVGVVERSIRRLLGQESTAPVHGA